MTDQPGLFDLAEVATVEPMPEAPAAVPLEGVTKWTRGGRGRCADCWTDQAADYAAGRPVAGRERATMRMISGSDALDLCGRHARLRGWRGTS
jgi:hypothetical protein